MTHGVDVGHFRKACDAATVVPAEMSRLTSPHRFLRTHCRLGDLELIRFLADSRPDWNFVLIGKSVTDTASSRE